MAVELPTNVSLDESAEDQLPQNGCKPFGAAIAVPFVPVPVQTKLLLGVVNVPVTEIGVLMFPSVKSVYESATTTPSGLIYGVVNCVNSAAGD